MIYQVKGISEYVLGVWGERECVRATGMGGYVCGCGRVCAGMPGCEQVWVCRCGQVCVGMRSTAILRHMLYQKNSYRICIKVR